MITELKHYIIECDNCGLTKELSTIYDPYDRYITQFNKLLDERYGWKRQYIKKLDDYVSYLFCSNKCKELKGY